MMQTISKIKATLTILVDKDEKKFLKIQNLYVNNATINLLEENEPQTKYTQFLNRDEREEMTNVKQTLSVIGNMLRKSVTMNLDEFREQPPREKPPRNMSTVFN